MINNNIPISKYAISKHIYFLFQIKAFKMVYFLPLKLMPIKIWKKVYFKQKSNFFTCENKILTEDIYPRINFSICRNQKSLKVVIHLFIHVSFSIFTFSCFFQYTAFSSFQERWLGQ